MNPKNQTKELASVFLFASLALNLISAPISAPSSVIEPSEASKANVEQIAFQMSFNEEFKEFVEHTVVGQTSFLANKTPPNKKRVVTQRLWLFVTAYSSTPDQTDSTPFITASGTHVRDGIVAANFLPIGTLVRFPNIYGEKIFVVEDRMNKRYYYRADIWMPTRWQAKQFGLRNTLIEVVREI